RKQAQFRTPNGPSRGTTIVPGNVPPDRTARRRNLGENAPGWLDRPQDLYYTGVHCSKWTRLAKHSVQRRARSARPRARAASEETTHADDPADPVRLL